MLLELGPFYADNNVREGALLANELASYGKAPAASAILSSFTLLPCCVPWHMLTSLLPCSPLELQATL